MGANEGMSVTLETMVYLIGLREVKIHALEQRIKELERRVSETSAKPLDKETA